MKLATLRIDGTTRAVRVDTDTTAIDLGVATVEDVLRRSDWKQSAAAATGAEIDLAAADYAPLITRPGKVVCVGMNYANHIHEMGRELPNHPTLFAKYAEALIGAHDEVMLPPEATAYDWECELAIVIGQPVRRANDDQAAAAIAGFAVLNDVTMRDWQNRTRMWLQGKTWESTTPLGPVLVTPDELPGGVWPTLDVRCLVDGEVMQSDNTADLVFDPITLVRYVSTIVTLQPGDVIASGTSGGVGHARTPPRYLKPGSELITEIQGLGRCVNRCVQDLSSGN